MRELACGVEGGVAFWVEHWRGGGIDELRARRGDSVNAVASVFGRTADVLSATPSRMLEVAMRFLKKVSDAARTAKRTADEAHEAWRALYPALAEYMETDTWEGGKERKTSTLLLFSDAGTLKACLNDRDSGMALWTSGGSLQAILESLNTTLEAGDGDWRPSFGQGKGKPGGNRGK